MFLGSQVFYLLPIAYCLSLMVMDGLHQIGRFLIIIGIVCAAVGGLILFSGRLPWLGRLPGDIIIQKKNFTFYFPLMTSILVSIIFTLLLWFFGRR